MGKSKEALIVKEVPDEETKTPIVLNISIGDKGEGSASFEAKGQLEEVFLPQTMVSNYNILCVSSDRPQDIVFNITEPKKKAYPIRIQNTDDKGVFIEHFSKKYLNGNYQIRVTGGTPATIFQITLMVN